MAYVATRTYSPTLCWSSPWLEQVKGALRRLFEESKVRTAKVGPGYHGAWETFEPCTVGGERFRPRLVMSGKQMLGRRDLNNAPEVGAAFELLRTALIVHDDVIDRDFVRRGIPNVSGRYRSLAESAGMSPDAARHVGLSAGVIAGHLTLSNAYRLREHVKVPPSVRSRTCSACSRAGGACPPGTEVPAWIGSHPRQDGCRRGDEIRI